VFFFECNTQAFQRIPDAAYLFFDHAYIIGCLWPFAIEICYYGAMIGIDTRLVATTFLVAVFVLSGVVHDVVPHDHGHGHAQNAIWQQLHSGMRHEEKKP